MSDRKGRDPEFTAKGNAQIKIMMEALNTYLALQHPTTELPVYHYQSYDELAALDGDKLDKLVKIRSEWLKVREMQGDYSQEQKTSKQIERAVSQMIAVYEQQDSYLQAEINRVKANMARLQDKLRGLRNESH